MTVPRPSTYFRQFVRLPLIGSAWVEREADRPSGLPFFFGDIDRLQTENASLMGFRMQAGRWIVIADRPAAAGAHRLSAIAWAALGAPLVTFTAIAACLLAGSVRYALASRSAAPVRS